MTGQPDERSRLRVRPTNAYDSRWIAELLNEHWGSTMMVSRGVLHDVTAQSGLAAAQDGEPIGLLTYNIVGDECEITLMQSLREGIGVGSALIDAARGIATTAGCRRLWLITTNDNLHALGFYQKRGFTLAAVYPNALGTFKNSQAKNFSGGNERHSITR